MADSDDHGCTGQAEGGDITDVLLPARPVPLLRRRSGLLALGVAAVLLPRLVIARPLTSLLTLVVLAAGTLMITRLAVALGMLVAVSPFEAYLDLHVSPIAVKALGLVVYTAYVLRILAGVERQAPRHAGMAALAAFMLLVLAATTVHPNGGGGLQTAVRYLAFGLLTLTLVQAMREGSALRGLLATLVLSSTAASLFALQTFLSGAEARAGGPLEDPNDLAFVLAVSVPIAAALGVGRRRREQALWGLAIIVLLTGVSFTLSRGAGLALGVLLLWALLRRLVGPLAVLAGGTLVLVVLGTVAVTVPELVDRAVSQKSYVASRNVDTRELRWTAAAQMAADNPVFGTGPDGFRENYGRYASQSRPDDQTNVIAHQMYLEVAAELGIPALTAFLLMLLLAFRACRRAAVPDHRAPPGERALALGVHGGLIVTCTAALFLTEQYYLPLWALVAAAFALELRQRQRVASPVAPA